MKSLPACIAMLALSAVGAATPAMAASDHVVLYSANDDTVNKLVADGFKQATGIDPLRTAISSAWYAAAG